MTTASTPRPAPTRSGRRPTARRRREILAAAAELFAARGFHGASIHEIGTAVGVSGPALYRHFSGKEDVLTEMLLGVSQDLLAGAREVLEHETDPDAALGSLLRRHIEFAMESQALITVHDRELENVAPVHRWRIRRTQRVYLELWVAVVGELFPDAPAERVRAGMHACFGLLNSTPRIGVRADTAEVPLDALLYEMARAAITAACS